MNEIRESPTEYSRQVLELPAHPVLAQIRYCATNLAKVLLGISCIIGTEEYLRYKTGVKPWSRYTSFYPADTKPALQGDQRKGPEEGIEHSPRVIGYTTSFPEKRSSINHSSNSE